MRRRELLLGTLALLILWQLLSWLLRTEVLPGPWVTAKALVAAMPRGLWRHFLVSGYRVVAGIALAMLLAVPAGLILGQSPRLNRLFSPIVYITYPIPKIVFLPVILLLLGIGDASKIFIIFLILFFQILVVVRDQAAALTALRVSIGTAVAVLFFAESFATSSGLGYYIIVDSWGRLAYADMYAGVVAMSLLGLLLYFVVDGLERWLAPWMFLRD